jgi:hypothetical protein
MRQEIFEESRTAAKSSALARRLEALQSLIRATEDRYIRKELHLIAYRMQRAATPPKKTAERVARRKLLLREAQSRTQAAAKQSGQLWGPEADDMVMNSTLTDEEIAKALGRTMRAVQTRRGCLRRREVASA